MPDSFTGIHPETVWKVGALDRGFGVGFGVYIALREMTNYLCIRAFRTAYILGDNHWFSDSILTQQGKTQFMHRRCAAPARRLCRVKLFSRKLSEGTSGNLHLMHSLDKNLSFA